MESKVCYTGLERATVNLQRLGSPDYEEVSMAAKKAAAKKPAKKAPAKKK